jgi:hypothetical protein
MKGERTLKQCTDLMQKYYDRGGENVELEEGVLGLGKILCFGEGLKTTIIKEVYVNAWTSTHTVIKYNKTPKKYLKIINS